MVAAQLKKTHYLFAKTVFLLCLPAGGAERSSLPLAGQTRHDQRATGVSTILTAVLCNVLRGCVTSLRPLTSVVRHSSRFQKDPTWSETGDRYLLKLFRDHLFHQVTEAGTPWIDLSHIVSCLNKVRQLFSTFYLGSEK